MQKNTHNKWLERKWIVGVLSFLLFTVFAILNANEYLSVPDGVLYLYGGMALTWLVAEGLLDYNKISKFQEWTNNSKK